MLTLVSGQLQTSTQAGDWSEADLAPVEMDQTTKVTLDLAEREADETASENGSVCSNKLSVE